MMNPLNNSCCATIEKKTTTNRAHTHTQGFESQQHLKTQQKKCLKAKAEEKKMFKQQTSEIKKEEEEDESRVKKKSYKHTPSQDQVEVK